jgi:hypothetical protein
MSSLENIERIFKIARENYQLTCKGKDIRMTRDFSAKSLKSRASLNDIC